MGGHHDAAIVPRPVDEQESDLEWKLKRSAKRGRDVGAPAGPLRNVT
jgi:hypothetical protein